MPTCPSRALTLDCEWRGGRGFPLTLTSSSSILVYTRPKAVTSLSIDLDSYGRRAPCIYSWSEIDTGPLWLSLISHNQAYWAIQHLIPAKPWRKETNTVQQP